MALCSPYAADRRIGGLVCDHDCVQQPNLENGSDWRVSLYPWGHVLTFDFYTKSDATDGRSDFNGLHSRRHDHEGEFYAFDMLVSDGEDLHKLPLSMRKTNLSRLLARRVDGIHLAPFEQGEIGPDLFRHACLMGLEGLVSKHRESLYRAGRSPRWVKVKNRSHPALSRVMDSF